MRHWTEEDLPKFDVWLRERGGYIRYPAEETNNGQFIIPMKVPDDMTGQEAVDKYDREVVNG